MKKGKHMLFYFNVAIRKSNLQKVIIEEKLIEWGGELFSQEPPQYEFNGTLIFDEYPDSKYFTNNYSQLIGSDFDIENYRIFRLLGDHLSELEKLVNTSGLDWEKHDLCKFLVELSQLDDYAIFLICDEENIEKRYRIETKEELVNIFCSCLKWDTQEGALITRF